jgi:hypothetical protein
LPTRPRCEASDDVEDDPTGDPRASDLAATSVARLAANEAGIVTLVLEGLKHSRPGVQVRPGFEPGSEAAWAEDPNPILIPLGYLARMAFQDPGRDFVSFAITDPDARVGEAIAVRAPKFNAADSDFEDARRQAPDVARLERPEHHPDQLHRPRERDLRSDWRESRAPRRRASSCSKVSSTARMPRRCHATIGVLAAVSLATTCALQCGTASKLADPPRGDGFAIGHPRGAIDLLVARSAAGEVARAGILRTAQAPRRQGLPVGCDLCEAVSGSLCTRASRC